MIAVKPPMELIARYHKTKISRSEYLNNPSKLEKQKKWQKNQTSLN